MFERLCGVGMKEDRNALLAPASDVAITALSRMNALAMWRLHPCFQHQAPHHRLHESAAIITADLALHEILHRQLVWRFTQFSHHLFSAGKALRLR